MTEGSQESDSADEEPALIGFGRDRVIDLREVPPAFAACHLLLQFCARDRFVIDTPLHQLVVGTFLRSKDTFKGILSLLLDTSPVQAAMLARALFEDLVITHWLVFNAKDSDWLVARFLEHRDAMALYQERLRKATGWGFPPVGGVDVAVAKRRQNELVKAYGAEAQKNWWDPGTEGKGAGEPIGLRGVAQILEDAAANHQMFHPRFAGGDEPLLRRMELVVQKWFSQSLHHTAVGLPIVIVQPGQQPAESADTSDLVAFTAFWMFAQQVYALHDLYDRPYDEFNEIVRVGFIEAFGADSEDLKPFSYA